MKTTAKELARAFYLAAREADEKDVPKLTKSFVEVAKSRGFTALLPGVLTALPAAIEEIEARTRVTITTATEISEADAAKAVAAAGIEAEGREIIRVVDAEAIGGIRIKTQDMVVDATVEKFIAELKQQFAK
jgi:F0F1-type ATP synthase delta subunit